MTFFYDHLGKHCLHISEGDSWHLYSAIDDDELACIFLEHNGQRYEVATGAEYLMEPQFYYILSSYEVIELYDAVVTKVNALICSGQRNINFSELKTQFEAVYFERWLNRSNVNAQDSADAK